MQKISVLQIFMTFLISLIIFHFLISINWKDSLTSEIFCGESFESSENTLDTFCPIFWGCLYDNWKTSLLPYLAGAYFRAELDHVGHVGEQKLIVDQSKLEK